MKIEGQYDAVVVGSGPNGLAAGITLAKAGLKVVVLEGCDRPGGGARSETLTLPGFIHDHCSCVFPFWRAPFLRQIEDAKHLWIHSPYCLAHPFVDGSAVFLEPSLGKTARTLGLEDAASYKKIFGFITTHWDELEGEVLGPLFAFPEHPWILGHFGRYAALSGYGFLDRYFKEERSRSLLSGILHHITSPLDRIFSAGPGIVLTALGHLGGWPILRGGTGKLIHCLVNELEVNGGTLFTGSEIKYLRELPKSRFVFWDVSPKQFLKITGKALPSLYRKSLEKYAYGYGVFKIDYALREPVPFTAGECRHAATVHLGGTSGEIRFAENEVRQGRIPERPFLILSQPSLFDSSRVSGKGHTLWVYTHVPPNSDKDISQIIDRQVERFAPGFIDTILKKQITTARDFEIYDGNFVGGDIASGTVTLSKILSGPVFRWPPYSIPIPGHFWCSSSSPPGAGVHGMCGYNAARRVVEGNKATRHRGFK